MQTTHASHSGSFNVLCFDLGDSADAIDRYTVVNLDDIVRYSPHGSIYGGWAASANPFYPLGFGQHTEAMLGEQLGEEILFDQLPEDVQRFVAQDFA